MRLRKIDIEKLKIDVDKNNASLSDVVSWYVEKINKACMFQWQAAQILGISQRTLRTYLNDMGVQLKQTRNDSMRNLTPKYRDMMESRQGRRYKNA